MSDSNATIISKQTKIRQKPRDFNEIDSLIFGEAIQTTEIQENEEERPLQQNSLIENQKRLFEESFHSTNDVMNDDTILSAALNDTRGRKKWGKE